MTTNGAKRVHAPAGAGAKASARQARVEVSPADECADCCAVALGVELTIRVGAGAAGALGVTTLTPMTLDILAIAAGGRMTIEVSVREIGRKVDPALLGLAGASACEARAIGPVTQIRSTGIELVFREDAEPGADGAWAALVYARLPGLAALGGGRYEITRGLARRLVETLTLGDYRVS